MKKLLSLLVCVTMLLSSVPFCVSAAADTLLTVDGVNTSRAADSLIVYNTPGKNTGTNPWGYEVVVNASGVITSVGGNDSLVPEGGFVLSGHGTASTALQSCCAVGRYARFFPQAMNAKISDAYIGPFYSNTYTVTGINAYRDSDELIIYTRAYGSTTRTNEWGHEVTVDENGIVIKSGGNNNAIPENGFVVSAHGDSLPYISGISAGMNCDYDETAMTVTFTYGETAMLDCDEKKIASAQAELQNAKNAFRVCDFESAEEGLVNAESYFASAKSAYLKSRDINAYESASKQLDLVLAEILTCLTESSPTEYRGVWIGYPAGTSRSAIAAHVQSLYEGGVNMVAIQTQYGSTMIYPTPSGSLFEQNPDFAGADVLQMYIEECHDRGMELHVWVPVFCVGSTGGANIAKSPAYKNSSWQLLDNNGANGDDNGFVFLDPCNSEVHEFLLETYQYILEAYDIDGFQLDYIRFPARSTVDFGYNDATVAAYKAKYGITPTYDVNASYWQSWCRFRADYVTQFVREMRALVDEVAPDVILSADVFPYMSSALTSIYQDYATWMSEGLLDLILPMTYGKYAFTENLPSIMAASNGTPVAAGIGLFESAVTNEDAKRQVQEAREFGCCGTVIFADAAFISSDAGASLVPSVWSTSPVSPFAGGSKTVAAQLNFTAKRISESVIPLGGIVSCDAAALASYIKGAANKLLIEGDVCASAVVNAVRARISTLASADKAKNALLADCDYYDLLLSMNPVKGEKRCTYNAESSVLYVSAGTSAEALRSMFGGFAVYTPSSDGKAFTGMTVDFGESALSTESACVVCKGDVSGDGAVGALDYLMIKRVLLNTITLNSVQTDAADIDGNGISALDYLKVKRSIIGTYTIPLP